MVGPFQYPIKEKLSPPNLAQKYMIVHFPGLQQTLQ